MSATRFLQRAIGINVQKIDLAACKQLRFSFDPFSKNVKSIRDFLFAVSPQHRRSTNYNCSVKVDVKSDRSAPEMEVKFASGQKAIFKTENLSMLDITKMFNKLCVDHTVKK